MKKQKVNPSHTKPSVASSVLDLIGNTPLVQLSKISPPNGATILGKVESLNPAGSVKDRIAKAMVESAENSGLITKGATLVEPTSGNTGIAYALIGKVKGYKVKLVMPANVCKERKGLMADFYGAEIVTSSPFEGSDGG